MSTMRRFFPAATVLSFAALGFVVISLIGVDTAHAQTTVSSPEILYDSITTPVLTPGDGFGCDSPAVDMSAYSNVVLHVTGPGQWQIQYRYGVAGFVNDPRGEASGGLVFSIDPRLGRQLRVTWGSQGLSTCPPMNITIVGFR
jgi:hypothetical protein